MKAPAAIVGLLLSLSVHAAIPVLVEMVDLSCSHCAAFAPTASRIAAQVRSEGGIFRVAPVGPIIGTDAPTLPVLAVYWSEIHQSDAEAQAIANSFYAGYQNNAALSGPAGITSWLDTRGITWPHTANLHSRSLTAHFFRAVQMAGNAGVTDLPAVVFVNPKSGAVTHVESWSGSAPDLGNRIAAYLKQQQEQ